MAPPRKPAKLARPRFVRHSKRAAWGIGRVADEYAGLVRVEFSDGVTRVFRADVLQPVADADVPPELLSAAAESAGPASPVTATKRPARPRRAAK